MWLSNVIMGGAVHEMRVRLCDCWVQQTHGGSKQMVLQPLLYFDGKLINWPGGVVILTKLIMQLYITNGYSSSLASLFQLTNAMEIQVHVQLGAAH